MAVDAFLEIGNGFVGLLSHQSHVAQRLPEQGFSAGFGLGPRGVAGLGEQRRFAGLQGVHGVVRVLFGLGKFFLFVQIGIAGGGGEDVGEQIVGVVVLRIGHQRLFAINDGFGVVALSADRPRLQFRGRWLL